MWRIYYDNGSVFGAEDGSWDQAPAEGVICVVVQVGEAVTFYAGADFYWRFAEDGSIAATSDLGPLLRTLGLVKFGRYTSNVNHERIMQRARSEWG
jgi:hypothetical protein